MPGHIIRPYLIDRKNNQTFKKICQTRSECFADHSDGLPGRMLRNRLLEALIGSVAAAHSSRSRVGVNRCSVWQTQQQCQGN